MIRTLNDTSTLLPQIYIRRLETLPLAVLIEKVCVGWESSRCFLSPNKEMQYCQIPNTCSLCNVLSERLLNSLLLSPSQRFATAGT